MSECPRCGADTTGHTVCPTCNLDLKEDSTEQTIIQPWNASPEKLIKSGFGKVGFDPSQPVLIYISGVDEPVQADLNQRFFIGRVGKKNGDDSVDLDLGPFGGKDKGVSRIHAALDTLDDQLVLIDLGSTNGTFINERRIPRDEPRPIRNGDSARFGQVVVNIYF